MILAIDPGVHSCGMAWFGAGKQLLRAVYAPAHECLVQGLPKELIIEMPRIYPGSGQQKGDLNDLLDLAAIVGQVEAWVNADSVVRVFPAKWKGQVPKKIMAERILSKLSANERDAIVHVGGKDHNTIDAIGIGLWSLGRL